MEATERAEELPNCNAIKHDHSIANEEHLFDTLAAGLAPSIFRAMHFPAFEAAAVDWLSPDPTDADFHDRHS